MKTENAFDILETKYNMDYKRVNNDVNGNPRYVFHFLEFISDNDSATAPQGMNRIMCLKNLALEKAKSLGGKTYRGKDFGGGIVIQSHNINNTIKEIKNLAK